MYISAFNNVTKADGIYETSIVSGKDPKKCIWVIFGVLKP